MLSHETATLRLFPCAQASLFLFQFRTSNVSSPFPRGAKNGALEAATAIRDNPIKETDSNLDFVSLPLALEENADRKTSNGSSNARQHRIEHEHATNVVTVSDSRIEG
ncbi:hypothetical protein LR48_Vigan02g114800 [Vigna angularis]|uniref:Uncharacterized protein n=1 Tax=Phaseolus angularis TaxID=3914 RepID=A0A0L9TWQ3_PHAAN|nr:uncharacterized protein HKW66_Vig0250610 [Vigna angularis]KOM34998.1 hypothetical protein LR48_Vigan02g114800 [Vigna angularis]